MKMLSKKGRRKYTSRKRSKAKKKSKTKQTKSSKRSSSSCASRCSSKYKINVKRIKKHMPFFATILQNITNKKQRDALIDKITSDQMNTIKHVVNCFLRHQIKLPPEEFKKMKRQRKLLYALTDNAFKAKTRKRILRQKGGFILGPLLASLAPSLVEPIIKPVVGAVGQLLTGRR